MNKVMKNIFILSLLFMCGCHIATDETRVFNINNVVNFNNAIRNTKAKDYIYDIVDSVKLIKLEVNEESVLYDFDNFEIGNGHIYILDRYKGGSVVIFKTDGSFVKRLPFGDGPEDINKALDITFDSVKNELIVYTGDFFIKKYTTKGDFISSYSTKYIIHDMLPLKSGNGYIAVQKEIGNDSQLFSVIWTDTCFVPQRVKNLMLRTYNISEPHFLTYDKTGNINLSRFMDNNIYSIDDNAIKLKQRIVFNDCELNLPKVVNPVNYEELESAMINDKYLYTGKFCETNNYEFYTFKSKNDFRCILYRNKKNGKVLGPIKITADASLIECPSIYAHSYGDYFIAVEYHSDDFMQYAANSKVFSKAQMDLLRTSTVDDNPLIIMYKLKDEI